MESEVKKTFELTVRFTEQEALSVLDGIGEIGAPGYRTADVLVELYDELKLALSDSRRK